MEFLSAIMDGLKERNPHLTIIKTACTLRSALAAFGIVSTDGNVCVVVNIMPDSLRVWAIDLDISTTLHYEDPQCIEKLETICSQ